MKDLKGFPSFSHEVPSDLEFTNAGRGKFSEKSWGHVLSYSQSLSDYYLQYKVRAYQCHCLHKIDNYPRQSHTLCFHCNG